MPAWLETEDGSKIAVTAGGVLVGRRADCDVLTSDAHASRVHALVRMGSEGCEVHALGKANTSVDGKVVSERETASDGSVIEIPGRKLTVRVEVSNEPGAGWVLESWTGGRYGVSLPFTVGGGVEDDLVVADWPKSALTLEVGEHGLVATATEIQIDGLPADGGAVPVNSGTSFEFADTAFVLLQHGPVDITLAEGDGLPREITLEFLPRGGILTLSMGKERASVVLADRRCDLVATLLKPPGGTPGDYVSDEDLVRRVWGPTAERGRTDVNLLLHRVRKDLASAELDAMRLLQRSPAGGATRFQMRTGCNVEIR